MANKHPDPVFVLRGAHHSISSVDFFEPSSDENHVRYLASGTQDGSIFVWDLKICGRIIEWKAHSSSVMWVKHLDSSNLWTCGRSESAVLWDIKDGTTKVKRTFPLEEYLGFSQCDVANLQNDTLLCAPGPSQESVTLWSVNSSSKISCLTPSEPKKYGAVMQCKFIECNRGLYLLTAYENGDLTLWDWTNNKIISSISCSDHPLSLAFDPFLMKIVCGTAEKNIFVFKIEEETLQMHCERDFQITNPGIGCAASRPDSKIYAVGGWDHRVRLFSWKKHQPLAVLSYHKKSVDCISFSKAPVVNLSKGYLMAAGSSDNSISLWDLYN